MTRFLAVDWDDVEYRYVYASIQKNSLKILKAKSVDWGDREIDDLESQAGLVREERHEGTEDSIPDDVPAASDHAMAANRLESLLSHLPVELKKERIEHCPTLICLGRNKVEMVYQSLPPCRETELPVLLKNQLLRELSTYSDFDPLDYLSLSGDENESRRVLALTIPLSFRQNLVRNFRKIGRPPRQISFRAAASAELFLQSDLVSDDSDPVLIVDAVGPDVDLILLEGRRIVSIRSFRLPTPLPAAGGAGRIADEIERTSLVGFEGLEGRAISKIVLFGSEEEHADLKTRLDGMPLEILVVPPFQLPWIENEAELLGPGRFAPLLGILSDRIPARTNEMKPYRIDFLHPKEAPKPVNLIRSVFLVAILLLIVGSGLYFWNREIIRGMEEDLAKLQAEYKDVSEQYRQIQPIWNVLRQTQYWDSQGVSWLDELRGLSVSLPGEQDLVVSQISFASGGANPRVAGTIQLNGMIRDPSVLWTFQRSLNAAGAYQMRNPDLNRNPAGGGYPWLFRTTISKLRR